VGQCDGLLPKPVVMGSLVACLTCGAQCQWF
jgi:hypothetical protein